MMTQLLALCLLCVLLAACDVPPTATPAPIVTPTDTPTASAMPTGTPTAAEQITATSTPSATLTATPWPTCAPALMGDALLSCWLDSNADSTRQSTEQGVSCTVLVSYTGTLPAPYPGILELQSNVNGSWGGALLPGTWTAQLQAYDEGHGYVPYHDNPEWLNISIGDVTVLLVRFWQAVVPGATATPNVTPTVAPAHQCLNYAINCVPIGQACGAGRIPDESGICGSGFSCCKVTP